MSHLPPIIQPIHQVFMIFAFTWLFRIRSGSLLTLFKRK